MFGIDERRLPSVQEEAPYLFRPKIKGPQPGLAGSFVCGIYSITVFRFFPMNEVTLRGNRVQLKCKKKRARCAACSMACGLGRHLSFLRFLTTTPVPWHSHFSTGTSHLAPRTSPLTPRTLHVERRTSHVARRTDLGVASLVAAAARARASLSTARQPRTPPGCIASFGTLTTTLPPQAISSARPRPRLVLRSKGRNEAGMEECQRSDRGSRGGGAAPAAAAAVPKPAAACISNKMGPALV